MLFPRLFRARKKKDAKKALKATPAPKRAVAAAPVTRARAPRVKGAERAVVCLSYINGALQTKSTGECFDVVSRGTRYFACASGHSCKVTPATAQAPFVVYKAALLNNIREKELKRLRAPVFVALKGYVVISGAAGGATSSASRALGAASATLYFDSSSELEGGEETPATPTATSPAAPAAAAPAVAVGGASGATIAAAGVSAGLTAFRAIVANKPRGVTLTLE
ncbi:hypothetical protein BKA61DRAFT_673955 [Leptodontidium sp. MPI-SDFR-AT-0119]|nr:hypothetical protein BKA61DRAFT_673955 [Leptodontidium sp. MPI-SDFR-AT-0119]